MREIKVLKVLLHKDGQDNGLTLVLVYVLTLHDPTTCHLMWSLFTTLFGGNQELPSEGRRRLVHLFLNRLCYRGMFPRGPATVAASKTL